MENMDVNPEKHAEYDRILQSYKNKDIAECFANMHVSFTNELDGVRGDVKKLEARVVHLEYFATHTNEVLNTIKPEVNEVVTKESRERLKLEIWGRKWNLIIKGIQGNERETPRETVVKVRQFFVQTLNFPEETAAGMLLQEAHRLKGGQGGKKNIIIRVSSLMDRDDILEAAMKLAPGSGYSVLPDLPPEVSKLRSTLLKKRYEMSAEEKKKVKVVYQKDFPFVVLKQK